MFKKLSILLLLLSLALPGPALSATKTPSDQREKIQKTTDKKKNQKTSKANSAKKKKKGQKQAHLSKFKVPKSLEKDVDFWTLIYSRYDRNFEIFHDTEHLHVVYSILDFTDLYDNPYLSKKARRALFFPRLKAEEVRLITLLNSLHQKRHSPQSLSKEEKRLYRLFQENSDPDKFLKAADEKRVRAQTGVANKLKEALPLSTRYLPEFKKIFKEAGLPQELANMAFVESMFQWQALSKVGAAGMWQFMPGTARTYGLRVDKYVDERLDPFLAARAATRLLKHNYEVLGTWPLAINAYNSGRGNLLKAIQTVGSTNIEKIIKNFRQGGYGFASRNFYPSFLAILRINQDPEKYFGNFPKLEAEKPSYLVLKEPKTLPDLSKKLKVPLNELNQLNRHYKVGVLEKGLAIPAGYRVRVPGEKIEKRWVQNIKKSPKEKSWKEKMNSNLPQNIWKALRGDFFKRLFSKSSKADHEFQRKNQKKLTANNTPKLNP